ncbi:MAG: NAD(P)H-hydrate epimerase [Anaerolineae bacterium]|nr:NAD(P)H-hydrate epimerase [Anaerolineae bacterium]MCI0609251.1 NAD(P)H-hydrate epimerase [Anaerolineae bacterium]
MKFPALTTDQMKEVDRLMIESYGVTLGQMMENAGRNLAELARRMLGSRVVDRRITILCGAGNNGGGGMVAARHLHNMGAQVSVVLASEPNQLKGVPAHQWSILRAMELDRVDFDFGSSSLILDSLLGYGSQGNPWHPINDWIKRANDSGIPILSLDSPSGLNTTTGIAGQPCIQAEATMTLTLPKTGLLASQAKEFIGMLYLADIGVPPELYRRIGIQVESPFVRGSIVSLDNEEGQ